ncbi:MAG: hypothetical protein CL678_12995 [Bdellovibrionaceae bacterium]|nr:hypothetical protein [Pseudobdellovibrionaceae bacterium]
MKTLIIILSLLVQGMAFGKGPHPSLPNLNVDFRKSLNVELSDQQWKDFQKTFDQVERFEAPQLSYEELLEPEDYQAFSEWSLRMASSWASLVRTWINLRAISFRADAELQFLNGRAFRRTRKVYRQKKKIEYQNAIIQAFNFSSKGVVNSISYCNSVLGVYSLRDATDELIQFAQHLNFAISNKKSYKGSVWNFEHPLNRQLLSLMISELVGPGKTPTPDQQLLASVLLDFLEPGDQLLETTVRELLVNDDIKKNLYSHKYHKVFMTKIPFKKRHKQLRALAESKVESIIWRQ